MLLPILLLSAAAIAPDAAVPFKQPQLAAAHGQVAMTFGGGSTIYFAPSPDQGKTFAAPIKVATVGALALGRHRGPRLAILKDAMVISAVIGDKPQAGTLASWRSTDRGKTWTRAADINDVPEAAREGLHAMTADAHGNLYAVWLDLRGKGTRLYGSKSADAGKSWSKNELVYASPDGTICQCCDPSLAAGDDGSVYAMWRNVIDGNRDMYTAKSTGGLRFEEARKLGSGTWKLDACPMDGGGLGIDKGRIVSAWRRDGAVFLTAADNSEKQIGTGKDVAFAHTTRGSYVAWTRGAGLEVFGPKAAAASPLAATGAYVTLIGLPDGSVLAAWEAHDTIESKRLE